MENLFEKLLGLLNSSGISLWLIPLLVIILIGAFSKAKDIFDFERIERNDIKYYAFVNDLLKDSLPDKKSITRIEYKLNNDIKLLWHKYDKLKDKDDFKFIKSPKCLIPIRIFCDKKDRLWVEDISNIKIEPAKLERTLKLLQKHKRDSLSNESEIKIFVSYAEKNKPSSLFLNAGLYNALFRKLLSTIQFEETVSDTMIGAMLNKKAKEYTKSYTYLSLSIIIYIAISIFTSTTIEPLLMYAIIFFLASTFINQKILEFRIAKGYYGSNEYESREMIRFITENSNKSNFPGGTGLKPFPADDESKSVWLEGCVTV